MRVELNRDKWKRVGKDCRWMMTCLCEIKYYPLTAGRAPSFNVYIYIPKLHLKPRKQVTIMTRWLLTSERRKFYPQRTRADWTSRQGGHVICHFAEDCCLFFWTCGCTKWILLWSSFIQSHGLIRCLPLEPHLAQLSPRFVGPPRCSLLLHPSLLLQHLWGLAHPLRKRWYSHRNTFIISIRGLTTTPDLKTWYTSWTLRAIDRFLLRILFFQILKLNYFSFIMSCQC